MSTQNDGMSRFVPSTCYALPTFAAGIKSSGVETGTIVCNTYDAEAVKMTLNSDVGLFVTGLLPNQDIFLDGGAALVMTFPVPFMQSINVIAAGSVITLPVGPPAQLISNGTRFSILTNAAATIRIPAGSPRVRTFTSNLIIGDDEQAFTYASVAPGDIAVPINSMVSFTSFNDIWQATIIRT